MSQQRAKTMTPEERDKRRIRARRRFKAVVRLTIANLYWLQDDDSYEMGDNLIKNIRRLTHRKGRRVLNMKAKSILTKSKYDRSEEEVNYIIKIISGLKAFRRYPSHVKSQLAAVTFFSYFGPGRVIVKQDQEPRAIYFIIEGEVQVIHSYFDKVLKEQLTVELGTMTAGSMFGEVSILHNMQRVATITTLTDCEFLLITKKDFEKVLKATVMAEWEDLRRCISCFDYFQDFDAETLRESCVLAKKKIFSADEIVIGDGIGDPLYVHFIVEGSCDLVEHLVMYWHLKDGKKCYELDKDYHEETYDLLLKTASEINESVSSASPLVRRISSQRADTIKGFLRVLKKDQKAPRFRRHALDLNDDSKNIDIRFIRKKPEDATGFIISQSGERKKNRRVVARERTVCLLLPQYWIFHRNETNIWNKLKSFLDRHTPTRNDLFQEFLRERKWIDYKSKLFNQVLENGRKVKSNNTINNVPYSIRMKSERVLHS